MASNPSSTDTTLRIEKTYAASQRQVYDSWVNPDVLRKWFAPSPEFTIPALAVDVRVGGKYRIVMQSPDGKLNIVVGEYVELTPHSKLAFTWSWENAPEEATDTLVTIEIASEGSGARLTLTHERFPSTDARDHHQKGWMALLGRLDAASV
jgi:uncharacterized protein YndB with AHSA1/START domain